MFVTYVGTRGIAGPVASVIWSSATRMSCSSAIRSSGSTFGSVVPPDAIETAICVAWSMLELAPPPPNSCMKFAIIAFGSPEPNIFMKSNSSLSPSNGSESLTSPSYRRDDAGRGRANNRQCHGERRFGTEANVGSADNRDRSIRCGWRPRRRSVSCT